MGARAAAGPAAGPGGGGDGRVRGRDAAGVVRLRGSRERRRHVLLGAGRGWELLRGLPLHPRLARLRVRVLRQRRRQRRRRQAAAPLLAHPAVAHHVLLHEVLLMLLRRRRRAPAQQRPELARHLLHLLLLLGVRVRHLKRVELLQLLLHDALLSLLLLEELLLLQLHLEVLLLRELLLQVRLVLLRQQLLLLVVVLLRLLRGPKQPPGRPQLLRRRRQLHAPSSPSPPHPRRPRRQLPRPGLCEAARLLLLVEHPRWAPHSRLKPLLRVPGERSGSVSSRHVQALVSGDKQSADPAHSNCVSVKVTTRGQRRSKFSSPTHPKELRELRRRHLPVDRAAGAEGDAGEGGGELCGLLRLLLLVRVVWRRCSAVAVAAKGSVGRRREARASAVGGARLEHAEERAAAVDGGRGVA